jgi:hypothetical protein
MTVDHVTTEDDRDAQPGLLDGNVLALVVGGRHESLVADVAGGGTAGKQAGADCAACDQLVVADRLKVRVQVKLPGLFLQVQLRHQQVDAAFDLKLRIKPRSIPMATPLPGDVAFRTAICRGHAISYLSRSCDLRIDEVSDSR